MIYDFLMEYRVSPIALDTAPRFSWKLKSEGKNVLQIAYQIQVMYRCFAGQRLACAFILFC